MRLLRYSDAETLGRLRAGGAYHLDCDSDLGVGEVGDADPAEGVAEAAGAVVYVSSDYVFDWLKGEPYVESDPVNPLSAYGRSKLEGELATAEANPRYLIARSSWLYGHGGKNFVVNGTLENPKVGAAPTQVSLVR